MRDLIRQLREARAIRLPKARVKKLADELTALVHKKLKDSPRPLGSTKQVVAKQFPFLNAAGEHVQPYVVLRSHPTKSKLYIKDLGAGIGKSRQVRDDVIVVNINGSIPQSDLKKATSTGAGSFSLQLYKVLLHELTHAAEPVWRKSTYKVGGSRIASTDEVDKKAYYNDPKEVRAYLQEIIDELEGLISNWPKLSKALGPGEALRLVLKNSETWREIEGYLTPKNRRHIIKAVSTAIRDRLG